MINIKYIIKYGYTSIYKVLSSSENKRLKSDKLSIIKINSDPNIIRFLFEETDYNINMNDVYTLLFNSARYSWLNNIRYLVDEIGVNLYQKNNCYETFFRIVVNNKNLDIF